MFLFELQNCYLYYARVNDVADVTVLRSYHAELFTHVFDVDSAPFNPVPYTTACFYFAAVK